MSVCLPVFNGQEFLSQAIESVLAQNYDNFELIVSDDHSSDSSPAIVEKYARIDRRIKHWRNEKNFGLFANYNECLKRASGKYIKPFAQDDLLERCMLRDTVAVAEALPKVSLISTGRKILIGQEGDLTQEASFSIFPAFTILNGEKVIRSSLIPTNNYIGEPTAVLFRSCHIGQGFDFRFHHLGDLEYWLRILLDGDYYYLDSQLCTFRLHANGSTNRNISNMLYPVDHLLIARKFQHLLSMNLSSEEQILEQCLERLALDVEYYYRQGKIAIDTWQDPDVALFQIYGPQAGEQNPLDSRRILTDLLLFRELAFHGLRALGVRLREENTGIKEHCKLIAKREGLLQLMLGSRSWQCTRWLRELKSCITGLASVSWRKGKRKSQVARRIDDFDDQTIYLAHLRENIGRIRRSTSWRMTAPLRNYLGEPAR